MQQMGFNIFNILSYCYFSTPFKDSRQDFITQSQQLKPELQILHNFPGIGTIINRFNSNLVHL